MSKRPMETECPSKRKPITPNDAEIPNQGTVAVVVDGGGGGSSNEESPSKIFKLNIDCFEAMADYLSLEELHALGQTCKRFQKAAGHVFKATYPAIRVKCLRDGIHISDSVQVNGFCDYIQNMTIDTDNMDCFRFIESNSFSSIKRIHISGIKLNDERIGCIKEILNKVETVEIRECEIDGEFHAKFLEFCMGMKRLAVRPKNSVDLDSDDEVDFDGPAIVIGASNDWMLRQYPMLEQFELTKNGHYSGARRLELKTLLERNPNIRVLATSGDALYQDWKKAAGLNLDVLAIDCDDDLESLLVADILEKLSKKQETFGGFYERLHIYSYGITAAWHIDHINSISKLENLYMHDLWAGPLKMTNLKEVRLSGIKTGLAGPVLVDGLVNIERVSFGQADLVDVLSFIRGSRKLTKLRIESFAKDALPNGSAINLLTWDNQRKQLDRARKVMIYVEEKVYLATKWATHNGQTDYSLVELKRHAAHDCNYPFGFL